MKDNRGTHPKKTCKHEWRQVVERILTSSQSYGRTGGVFSIFLFCIHCKKVDAINL